MAPTIQLKVIRVSQLTSDVTSYRLEHPSGEPLPSFAAGAHIDVHLPDGMVRQYSLCNRPIDTQHYLIAVKREPSSRGGSQAMHGMVVEGSLLTVGMPRNRFPISKEADFHLLLAGGIGITPLLAMARHLHHDRKPYRLEYFCRAADSTPFYELIAKELGSNANFNIGLEPDNVRKRLADILQERPDAAHAYVCGPSAFIDMATEVASRNWPAKCVHLEHFSPVVNLTTGENHAFRLKLAQSNHQFDVPADKSILDVLRDNNIPCDSSCGEGTCGSCMVAVLEGEVEHRDSFLSADEKKQGEVMMICVSRAKNEELTIDL